MTDAQAALVTAHLDNARKSALRGKRQYRHADVDELHSAALYGLVRAAMTYDCAEGASFQSHAFEAMDWWIHRTFRHARRQAGWSYSPTRAERRTGLHGMVRRVSVQAWPTNPDGTPVEFVAEPVDIEADITRRQQRAMVLASALSERDRIILEGLLNGRTYKELGRSLGLSWQRVWQLAPGVLARATQYCLEQSTRKEPT